MNRSAWAAIRLRCNAALYGRQLPRSPCLDREPISWPRLPGHCWSKHGIKARVKVREVIHFYRDRSLSSAGPCRRRVPGPARAAQGGAQRREVPQAQRTVRLAVVLQHLRGRLLLDVEALRLAANGGEWLVAVAQHVPLWLPPQVLLLQPLHRAGAEDLRAAQRAGLHGRDHVRVPAAGLRGRRRPGCTAGRQRRVGVRLAQRRTWPFSHCNIWDYRYKTSSVN